jgi:hypothetical protein
MIKYNCDENDIDELIINLTKRINIHLCDVLFKSDEKFHIHLFGNSKEEVHYTFQLIEKHSEKGYMLHPDLYSFDIKHSNGYKKISENGLFNDAKEKIDSLTKDDVKLKLFLLEL